MTSSVNGGPHKPLSATKPQGQWITTTRSSLIIDTRTFHHIVGTTFLFPFRKESGIEVGFQRSSTFFRTYLMRILCSS